MLAKRTNSEIKSSGLKKKKALVSRFKGILYDVDALNICISME